jgi:hypothetical protein
MLRKSPSERQWPFRFPDYDWSRAPFASVALNLGWRAGLY